MIEHFAAIAFLFVIVSFSTGAIWLNYRLHALEADRAGEEALERAEKGRLVERAFAASGA